MRVLLWMRGGDGVAGGHRIQINQTAVHLRQLGLEVGISFEEEADVDGYDLVHGFGLNTVQVRHCRLRRVPVVFSPIHWSLDYTLNQTAWPIRIRFGLALLKASILGKFRDKCVALLQRRNRYIALYESVDMLLPNSELEAESIRKDFGVTTPMHIVPNAVDPLMFADGDSVIQRDIDVLYVGRFEPHKNQLGLAKAMCNTGLKVLMVGPGHVDHPEYAKRCMEAGGKDVEVRVKDLPQSELPALYHRAKVHCLPSFFETTGLVSLEAALCGCKIVSTSRGFARGYLSDFAWYCDPDSAASIRQAVKSALETPLALTLKERILTQFTWKQTAEATQEAYLSVLATSSAYATG